MRTHIVTYAQDRTPVHAGFWQNLQALRQHTDATLHVVAGTYRNPTSKHEKHYADAEGDAAYTEEVRDHLLRKSVKLCRNLTLYGDMRVQPTASNPLGGLEVFASGTSAIIGHPKRALQVIPTSTRSPRVLWTTSACTVKNYSHSRAGQRGDKHHVIGALVVEIDTDGTYFCRHISADAKGAFTDLDLRVANGRVGKAPEALSLTLGDWHSGLMDGEVLEATRALADVVRPKHLVLHDVLDFHVRSHHGQGMLDRFESRYDHVEREVSDAVGDLNMLAGWRPWRVTVVRANHDEHFDRWLAEADPNDDPINAAYHCEVKGRVYRHFQKTGVRPMAFELEARRLGVKRSVRFLRRNESLKLAGVEHGFHGDKGIGGSRGTPRAYAKLGVKVTTGHTHTPWICDGSYVVGVTAQLDHGYNDLPGTWLNAHCVLHADGKRQLIIVINGRFRGTT